MFSGFRQDMQNMEDPLEIAIRTTHCRFCGESKNYTEVLDLAGDLKTLSEYLRIIKFLKIDYLDLSQTNKLPKSTCETCYDQFQEAYKFFQKINEIHSYFKKCKVVNIKTEPICEANSDKGTEDAGTNSNDSIMQNEKCDELETDKNSTPANSGCATELCIFCSEQKTSDNLVNPSEKTLAEDLTEMVDYFKMDHLAHKIKLAKTSCEPCYRTLHNAYNFFKNVERNQSLLEDIYCTKSLLHALLVKVEIEPCSSDSKESPNKDTNPLSLCAITIQDDESWTNYTYICCHCRIVVDNMEELRVHSKERHNVCYALRCADCDEQFVGYNEFVEHVRGHRDVLRLYCQYCNMRFESAAQCVQHVLVVCAPAPAQHVCEQCGEALPHASALEWHRKLYGGAAAQSRAKHTGSWEDYQWICQECGVQTADVETLRAHAQSAHKKCFAMRCADCAQPARNYKAFVAHVVAHRPHLKSFCQYCNSHYDDAEELNQHIIKHITSQQRPCNGCGQIFKDNLRLAKHKMNFNSTSKDPVRQQRARDAAKRRRVTKKTEPSLPKPRKPRTVYTTSDLTCTVCLKLFETITKLKRHVKTHDSKRRKNFVCKTCGRAFLTSHTMKEHMKVHQTKSEVCQVCQKEFHTTRALKHHIVTHSEERPFVCDECGNSFKSKRRLKCHLISHSEVKRFKCMYCYKEFNFKMNLKTHEYQHTGQRPYACELCERTFTNWTNCNKHMIRKHGVTLAKTKITAQGRVDIDRKTGEVQKLESDEKTKVWLDEMMKPGKPGKRTESF